jgi:hypothetical protein
MIITRQKVRARQCKQDISFASKDYLPAGRAAGTGCYQSRALYTLHRFHSPAPRTDLPCAETGPATTDSGDDNRTGFLGLIP